MELKPFLELLKRAMKSPYDTFLMSNRMIFQCYDISWDTDQGFHYILHIPDTEEYVDEFYDKTVILEPSAIVNCYTEGHKKLLEVKKQKNAKPKEVREEVNIRFEDGKMRIKFLYFVQDELVTKELYETNYPISPYDSNVSLVEETYYNILHRIKPGGLGIAFNGDKHGLFERALNSPDIYFFKVKLGNEKVKVPLYKSLFSGFKEWEEFFISIQETVYPGIYLYVIHFTVKGLTDQYIGYIQNF